MDHSSGGVFVVYGKLGHLATKFISLVVGWADPSPFVYYFAPG